jgi:hypothetical protein
LHDAFYQGNSNLEAWQQATTTKNLNEDLVQITPFEELTLGCAVCSSNARYTLSTAWTPNTMDKRVRMQLSCYSEIECGDLAMEMRERPEMFSDLRPRGCRLFFPWFTRREKFLYKSLSTRENWEIWEKPFVKFS